MFLYGPCWCLTETNILFISLDLLTISKILNPSSKDDILEPWQTFKLMWKKPWKHLQRGGQNILGNGSTLRLGQSLPKWPSEGGSTHLNKTFLVTWIKISHFILLSHYIQWRSITVGNRWRTSTHLANYSVVAIAMNT